MAQNTVTLPIPVPVDLAPLDLLYRICQVTETPAGDRYFAVIVKVDPSIRVGNVLAASSHVGNYVSDSLPPGVRVTRSIEIDHETAVRGIR